MVIIWCYLADNDDPVYSQDTLMSMNISAELKQTIEDALHPDPKSRLTLGALRDRLSKIKGHDQLFKLSELKDIPKKPTNSISYEVPVEVIKLKPIHAKLIYHICSLLHKLSATRLFDSDGDDVYKKIVFLLDASAMILQSFKDESPIGQYTADINTYKENIKKYFLEDKKIDPTSRISQPNELIDLLEQSLVRKIRTYIDELNPFDSISEQDQILIRNCKRLMVLFYLVKTIGFQSPSKDEDGIIAYKLSRLNEETTLEKEYALFYPSKTNQQVKPVESHALPLN
jgi:hypothetical protein